MKKVINPCKSTGYHNNGNEFLVNVYVEIEYKDGKLSLHGVVGPKRNGDCYGSAGQCVDSIREGVPTDGWTKEMLEKLCNIWDEWHLNDMRPYCQHQKELGWREQAREEITLYHYKLNDESAKKQKEAEKVALESLRCGVVFMPTDEQTMYASMEYFLDTYDKIEEGSELSKYYVPYKSCIGTPETEIKNRGLVRYDESDRGLLCKPCPVCGYKYGTSWIKEDVPQEVIDWLFALPETTVKPAWV